MKNEQADHFSNAMRSNPRLLLASVLIIIMAIVLVSFAIFGQTSRASGLLPVLASPTMSNGSDSETPEKVSFPELNTDPLAYLNKSIEVSGSFLALAPTDCPKRSGPDIQWALVSEELQLDVQGFERIIRLVAPDTEMTVQGIWRLYQGPLGCGKGPAPGSAWYLQVTKIVQPNPLVGAGSLGNIGIENAAPGLPSLLPSPTLTMTPVPTPTFPAETPELVATPESLLPTFTPDLTGTALVTAVATQPITPPPTVVGGTPTPFGTPSAPNITPVITSTVGPGTPVPGTTSTPITPLPPTSTQTAGGYPGDPTATLPPNGYP